MQFTWEEFMDVKSKIVIYYKSTEVKKWQYLKFCKELGYKVEIAAEEK